MDNTATVWMTTDEAMQHLRITSRQTLNTYVTREGLPVHRTSPRGPLRFERGEIDDWLRSRCSDNEPGQDVA